MAGALKVFVSTNKEVVPPVRMGEPSVGTYSAAESFGSIIIDIE
jgi:hypothetical protein